jgi:hypothetical protein
MTIKLSSKQGTTPVTQQTNKRIVDREPIFVVLEKCLAGKEV